jgi:hypothetical protein
MKNPGRTLASRALLLCAGLCAGLLGGCDAVFASYLAFDPPCSAADPELVLCLPLDGSLMDLSKNGFVATAPPSLRFEPGRVREAGVFGRESLFTLPDNPAWAVPGFTFAAWVRPDELPAESVMRFGLLDRSGRFGIFLYPSPDAPGELTLTCALNSDRGLGPHIPLHTFSHVACSTDRDTLSFYLNGQLVRREPFPSQPGSEVHILTHIGSSEPEGEARLVGALDELVFYSSVRTDEQILRLFQRGQSP